jgi:hypothetical protein
MAAGSEHPMLNRACADVPVVRLYQPDSRSLGNGVFVTLHDVLCTG